MPALDQEKRKTFTLLYVSTGNATQAAIGAGCPPPRICCSHSPSLAKESRRPCVAARVDPYTQK